MLLYVWPGVEEDRGTIRPGITKGSTLAQLMIPGEFVKGDFLWLEHEGAIFSNDSGLFL